MERPKMILFDYGETLVGERLFDGLRGTRALMEYVQTNPKKVTAEEIQALADEMFLEIWGEDPKRRQRTVVEVVDAKHQKVLYESLGITFSIPPQAVERLFWDNAAPGDPKPGICALLEDLWQKGIRTGVVSNLSYSGDTLRERINRLIPSHHFEFIIASSEYVFRKPNRFIFQLALEKAGLSPEEVWFCGDNPICDVEGAFHAGMTPVWYTNTMQREDLDPPVCEHLRINEWDELKELLDSCPMALQV